MARKLLSVTVLTLLVAAAFAQSSTTTVNAPPTQVKTQTTPQGTNTQVKAPGTTVNQQGSNVAVKAPGTTAVATQQGTAVNAPLTSVRTNNQNGATSVRAPGTAVDVLPNGATRVVAPFTNVVIPGGRKLQQYTAVNAPTTAVRTSGAATSVVAPFNQVGVGPNGETTVDTPWANFGGRKLLRA